MSPDARPLPMVPSGCALDDGQLAEQLARYRHLSASVLRVDRDGPAARIQFGERVETELVDRTLAIERGCCSFLTVDYDASQRVLAIATDPEHGRDALSALLSAVTPSPGATAERDNA
jgi:hypothetical protein